jgi:hypothetical protein
MSRIKISQKISNGEKLARLSYLTVIDNNVHMGNNQFGVSVRNTFGFEWVMSKDVLDNECVSASQYEIVEKISQSDMIELILAAGHKVFTANFNKKPDPKVAIKKLQDLYPNKGIRGVGIAKRDDYNKAVIDAVSILIDGEERTITCRILSIDRLRGRLSVIDLEIDDIKNNIRQIDPRTLNWLIIDGVKYIIK